MAKMGRPRKEFDKKVFVDMIQLGCGGDEICWHFRDEKGKPADINTLSRWCKREFGVTFQEFRMQNKLLAFKSQLRRNLFRLSEKNSAVAIFLAKNYLGLRDAIEVEDTQALAKLDEILDSVKTD